MERVDTGMRLERGHRIEITRDGEGADVAVVQTVEQRNWSRVALARTSAGSLFVKQFIDRSGVVRRTHMDNEQRGFDAVRALRCVRPVQPIGRSDARVVLAFPWLELQAVDTMLRSEPRVTFTDQWRRAVLPVLRPLVAELAALGDAAPPGIETKTRSYPSTGPALGLKGLDIRNLGVERSARDGHGSGVLLFDPGKPYVAPVEELGAKLLVSVGFLNWGRPVRRFAVGIPVELLDEAARELDGVVARDAVRAELDLQRQVRLGEDLAGGGLQGRIRRTLVQRLGPRYLEDLEGWCAQHGF